MNFTVKLVTTKSPEEYRDGKAYYELINHEKHVKYGEDFILELMSKITDATPGNLKKHPYETIIESINYNHENRTYRLVVTTPTTF